MDSPCRRQEGPRNPNHASDPVPGSDWVRMTALLDTQVSPGASRSKQRCQQSKLVVHAEQCHAKTLNGMSAFLGSHWLG